MILAKELPPMRLLRYINLRYPEFFASMDMMYRRKQCAELWDHSLSRTAPAVVLQYLCGVLRRLPREIPADRLEEVPVMQALAEWRQCKNIYDFDPTLTEELYSQASKKITVSRAMLSLPSYALYLRPNFGDEITGQDFFVYWSQGTTCDLHFLSAKGGRADVLLSLTVGEEDEPLEECLEHSAEIQRARFEAEKESAAGHYYGEIGDAAREAFMDFRDNIAKWLTLVLYLTAVNADVKRDESHFFKRTKRISDIPREVEILKVGERTGVHLRTMRKYHISTYTGIAETGHHRSPIMHVRRAHWHTYRMGSRKLALEDRKPILKWIPPVIVNGNGSAMEIVTIDRVKRGDA